MTDLAELVLRIKADATQLEQGMRKAGVVVQQNAKGMRSDLQGLAQSFGLVGTVGVATLVAFGKNALDVAGHIADLSDRIGFAGTTLAALEAPLAASGSNLDEFSAAINRMNNLVGEAAKGNEEAVKAFDQLGLSVTKLRQLTPEEQFYAIATAVGQVKDQAAQTETGMNIFGRGFAAMLPLLKQYEGDMRAAVEAQTELNAGISQETIDRLDRFGDALSDAGIRARNAFIEALGAILKVIETVPKAEKLADETASRYELGSGFGSNTKFGVVPEAGTRSEGPHTQYPLEEADKSARGDNAAILGRKAADEQAKKYAAAKVSLDEYVTSLERQSVILAQTPREQAALTAMYKQQDLAKKANVKLTAEEIERTKDLARTNYDLKQAQEEAARFQQVLHDKLSQTLTDIIFKVDSATDAFRGLAMSIAEAIVQKKIAGPLADFVVGSGGNKGLIDSILPSAGSIFGGFFADGGRPPMGKASVVGERGPEIFVPDTAGTIIPNGGTGGQTLYFQQTINLSPGVPELINQRIREAAPVIAAQAQAGVFQQMQQGGGASKLIGARA